MLLLAVECDQALPCLQGVPPAARRGHTAAMVSDRHLLLHGGFDGQKHLGDAFVLDTASGTWSRLELLGRPEQVPSARAFHTMVWLGHAALLLGGSGEHVQHAHAMHTTCTCRPCCCHAASVISCSSTGIAISSGQQE